MKYDAAEKAFLTKWDQKKQPLVKEKTWMLPKDAYVSVHEDKWGNERFTIHAPGYRGRLSPRFKKYSDLQSWVEIRSYVE